MKKITYLTFITLLLSLVLSASIVSAQTTSDTAVAAKKVDAKVAKLIARGDKEIDNRIEALNKLTSRVQEMKLVSDANKASLASQIQNQVAGLNSLKAKIDADTDIETLKTDVKEITSSFRIFALVIPQGQMIAAADRLNTLIGDFSAIGTKLQTRINEAQAAGKDVTSLNATLTDLKNQLTDAQRQAEAAVSRSVSLTPDNGDAKILEANKTALAQARADIKVGKQDLVDARKDINTIMKGLKAFKLPASNTAPTASTTTIN